MDVRLGELVENTIKTLSTVEKKQVLINISIISKLDFLTLKSSNDLKKLQGKRWFIYRVGNNLRMILDYEASIDTITVIDIIKKTSVDSIKQYFKGGE